MTTLQAQSSNTAARAEVTKYYAFNGSRAVMRQANNEVFYLFGDHLGSSSLVVDWQGRKISEMRYAPWGETRWSWDTDAHGYTERLFTSQRRQTASFVGSLYDFNARSYSSWVGRFLSADSIVPRPSDSQSLNRFSFVRNNPLKYVDPSGHCYGTWNGGLGCGDQPQPPNDPWVSQMGLEAALSIVVGDINDVVTVVTGYDLISQQTVPYGSGEWWDTAAMAVLPVASSSAKKFIRKLERGNTELFCIKCNTENPILQRNKGKIIDKVHIDGKDLGKDGVSSYCKTCSPSESGTWNKSMSEIRNFAKSIGLDPEKAAVYTPEFGDKPGHYSLFVDAFDKDGKIQSQYADAIDAFFRGK